MVLGHNINEGQRTQDVRISEDVSFDTMLLRNPTLKGLKKAGFLKPSPIQLHGIPLGKCGFDLLLEAKSGTGKTAVFTVIALEKLDTKLGVQAIVLAPTREIASQISTVITDIGSQYKDINVAVVMGGLPFKEDVEKFNNNVHIVVGSPGRLRHLIHSKYIDVSSVRLFVLDEADKLMESSFQPDINYIFSLLPKQKQVIMSSATYPEETKLFIQKYVIKAQHVCPDSNSVLLGIEQKVTIVPHHSNIVKQTNHRYEELKKILTGKQFKQCLIFCNYQVRVGELHRMLTRDKWPAEQLYGLQDQTDRLDALKTLQEYKCRILVSTDLAARGIDAPNVDVVINFEPPVEWQTYLHRIGRAGRYGSYGTAISILSEGKEETKFKETLGLTKMPFDLRNLWDGEPLNLNLNNTDSLEDDESSLISSPKTTTNDKRREDLLWKVLTMEPSEKKNDYRQEVDSFEELCNSFKMACKPNIETFSELMHSFTVDKNVSKNNNFEYKHMHAAKIPFDNKYFTKFEVLKSNKTCDPLNGDTLGNQTNPKLENNKLNEISVIMTPAHTKNENQLLETMGKKNIKFASNYKKSKSDENIHNEVLYNGNVEAYLEECVKQEQGSSCRKQSGDTEINPIEQTLLDAGLPTAFGKPTNKEQTYKQRIHTKNYCNKTYDYSYKKVNNVKLAKAQYRPMKSQHDNGEEMKYNSHKASNNKKGNYQKMSSFNVVERDQSELSSDTDEESEQSTISDEQIDNKSRMNYVKYASRTHNAHCRQNSKIYGNSQTQNRDNQFDLWYNQLKRQMQHIQYALYIDELRKLYIK